MASPVVTPLPSSSPLSSSSSLVTRRLRLPYLKRYLEWRICLIFEKLREMQYLHAALYECMPLYPPVQCVRSGDMKVQVEDDNVMVISGEREEEGSYLKMGKMMWKFSLPENVTTEAISALPENVTTEAISAVCKDGVITITVEKLPPPEPKQRRFFV